MLFFTLELTGVSPEITSVFYKHRECTLCGTRPIARIGHTTVRFGRKSDLTDICGTTESLIVRNKVLQLFITNRISGWRQGYLQVEPSPKLLGMDLNYHELVITGHTKKYAETVGLEIRTQCSLCGYTAYKLPQHGLELPLECWDGSDLFLIDELPGLCLFAEPVYHIIMQHKLTGITAFPISEWHAPLWAQGI